LCAVAIKSGDGVIVIDICGPKSDSEVKWPLLVKIYKDDKMSEPCFLSWNYAYRGQHIAIRLPEDNYSVEWIHIFYLC
jgi:hypothetical protein